MKLIFTDWDRTRYYSDDSGSIYLKSSGDYVLATLEEESQVRMILRDMNARAKQSPMEYKYGKTLA